MRGGCVIHGRWILNASFRRLFGRKGNFSLSVCIFVGSGVWWMNSYNSLWTVMGGFIIFS